MFGCPVVLVISILKLWNRTQKGWSKLVVINHFLTNFFFFFVLGWQWSTRTKRQWWKTGQFWGFDFWCDIFKHVGGGQLAENQVCIHLYLNVNQFSSIVAFVLITDYFLLLFYSLGTARSTRPKWTAGNTWSSCKLAWIAKFDLEIKLQLYLTLLIACPGTERRFASSTRVK